MTTTKEMVLKACETMGDDPDGLVCYYVTPCDGAEAVQCYHFTENSGCGAALVGPVGVEGLPVREFHAGYGGVEGEQVLCFSERYVYFKVEYDGAEGVTAVLRDPRYIETVHDIPRAV